MMKIVNLFMKWHDPRVYQILTLSFLFLYQFFASDFGVGWSVLAVTLLSTLAIQYAFYRLLKIPSKDFKSPLITAFSLTLLVKTNMLWVYPLVALIAIASKFLIRVKGRHIFNPANIAIVVMLVLTPNLIWVSPGQWGSTAWFGFVLVCFASLVLGKASRIDTALFFLGSYMALIFGRSFWLGDPIDIVFHQLQSGALLIFTFFMITDPKTTPDDRGARFAFVALVALVGFVLQFSFHIREGLFYALAIISLMSLYFTTLSNRGKREDLP